MQFPHRLWLTDPLRHSCQHSRWFEQRASGSALWPGLRVFPGGPEHGAPYMPLIVYQATTQSLRRPPAAKHYTRYNGIVHNLIVI